MRKEEGKNSFLKKIKVLYEVKSIADFSFNTFW